MRLNYVPIESYQSDYVSAALEATGLDTRPLEELSLPGLQFAEDSTGRHLDVPYVSIGEEDAPKVHVVATPMFTRLTDHFQLRLMAKQAVLGEDYRVLGVEAYNPETFKYDATAKRELATGSFAPLSGRVFDAVINAGVKDQQEVTLEGYSLGADIATQTAYDNEFNAARGLLNVVRLGATEAARTSQRGYLTMLKAFRDSGKNMGNNIVLSGVPALVEAWGVEPSEEFGDKTNKIFEKAATGGLSNYVRASGTSNLALLRGFATDVSTEQLRALATWSNLTAYVARTEDSTVFPEADFAAFEQHAKDSWRVVTNIEPGDHSSDDNIRLSAARSLFLARLII